jgi:excisionase family DNA binding protein
MVRDIHADGYLSPNKAAEFLDVSRRTIDRMLKAGELPSVKLNGARRIPKRALRERLDKLLETA